MRNAVPKAIAGFQEGSNVDVVNMAQHSNSAEAAVLGPGEIHKMRLTTEGCDGDEWAKGISASASSACKGRETMLYHAFDGREWWKGV